jgi:hypothetical protein
MTLFGSVVGVFGDILGILILGIFVIGIYFVVQLLIAPRAASRRSHALDEYEERQRAKKKDAA